MAEVKQGDTVKVHYTGTLDDGTVFDSSAGREPLQFAIGQGRIIPGLEQAVLGMNPGETKTVTIPAAQAYGPHDKERVLEVDRKELPGGLEPEVGQQLQVGKQGGPVTVVTVTQVTESTVTLDANHPLAGKDLTFELELVDTL